MVGRRVEGALLFIVLVIAALAGDALLGASEDALSGSPTPVTPAEIEWAGQKLRTYCQSCHGVGTLRFIRSDSNAELWSYLFRARAPNSGKLWKDGIVEVLSWPSDVAPPADLPMDPQHGRDWMPKGGKRAAFAADRVAEEWAAPRSTRAVLIELLKRGR